MTSKAQGLLSYKRVIPNGGHAIIGARGAVIVVRDVTGRVEITARRQLPGESGEAYTLEMGKFEKWFMPNNGEYTQVEVTNNTGAQVSLELLLGHGDFVREVTSRTQSGKFYSTGRFTHTPTAEQTDEETLIGENLQRKRVKIKPRNIPSGVSVDFIDDTGSVDPGDSYINGYGFPFDEIAGTTRPFYGYIFNVPNLVDFQGTMEVDDPDAGPVTGTVVFTFGSQAEAEAFAETFGMIELDPASSTNYPPNFFLDAPFTVGVDGSGADVEGATIDPVTDETVTVNLPNMFGVAQFGEDWLDAVNAAVPSLDFDAGFIVHELDDVIPASPGYRLTADEKEEIEVTTELRIAVRADDTYSSGDVVIDYFEEYFDA